MLQYMMNWEKESMHIIKNNVETNLIESEYLNNIKVGFNAFTVFMKYLFVSLVVKYIICYKYADWSYILHYVGFDFISFMTYMISYGIYSENLAKKNIDFLKRITRNRKGVKAFLFQGDTWVPFMLVIFVCIITPLGLQRWNYQVAVYIFVYIFNFLWFCKIIKKLHLLIQTGDMYE